MSQEIATSVLRFFAGSLEFSEAAKVRRKTKSREGKRGRTGTPKDSTGGQGEGVSSEEMKWKRPLPLTSPSSMRNEFKFSDFLL